MPIVRALLFMVIAALIGIAPPLQAADAPSDAAALATLDRAEAAMIGNPAEVIAMLELARPLIGHVKQADARDRLLARLHWLEGEALGRSGKADLAKRALGKAAGFAERSAFRTILHGRIILAQGSTAFEAGDPQSAFTHFRDAFAIFVASNDSRGQAMALQSIGTIYIDAGDYARVLRYYAQSAEVHPNDDRLALSALNNQGLAYKELGRVAEAERDYKRAFELAVKLDSAPAQARILNNLADVALARGAYADAEDAVRRGLQLARGDAAEWAPYLWGVRLRLAVALKRPGEAVRLLPRVFGRTPLTATNYLYRDFHAAASDALLATGNARSAFEHLRAVNRLDEQARGIRSSANAALLAAQFDTANQELRIARRDAALAAARARTQWTILGGLVLLLAAALLAFAWVTRSRNETRRANVELNKALAAKSEFLATTSHEIRTPLNGIMGMTQVLLRVPGVTPEVRERISVIDGAGKAMKAIVDDLLDMAKIEAGELTVDPVKTDLHALMRETANLWTAAAQAKGLAITSEHGDAPRAIIEDERKLRQILFNLVSNAVKFTTVGRVTLAARLADDRLRISVSDTGRGIPEDQRTEIFKAFHQIDGATTRQHGGTGLGLAISAKLAEALGGTIGVESMLGVGSTFTVDLPLRIDASAEPPAPVPQGPLSLDTARVLLVDANPLFHSMARAALGRAVGRLVIAPSHAEGCAAGPCDLLLVDLATIADAPLDTLRIACQARTVLRLVSPGGAQAGAHDALEKRLPPRGLLPAVERAIADLEPLQMAS